LSHLRYPLRQSIIDRLFFALSSFFPIEWKWS